ADQAFGLEARQRRVDRADDRVAARPFRDLAADGDAVRFRAEVRQRQHHVQLEFPENHAFAHVSSTNAYLDGRTAAMVGGDLLFPRKSRLKTAMTTRHVS